jgi:hypothetical protein
LNSHLEFADYREPQLMKGIEANKVLQTERGRRLSEQMRLVPMSKSISAVVLVAVLLGLSGSVQAGGPRYGDYYDGGGYYGGYYPPYPPRPPLPPVPVRQVPIPPPPPYGPPVYGWVFIPPPPPPSCGQYHYWAGDHCADARYSPPYVGPRW